MDLFIWGGVLIGFVVACTYFNYKEGVEHGIHITLETLEASGIINIADINENRIKAVIDDKVQSSKRPD